MTTASGLQKDPEIGSRSKIQLEAIIEESIDAIIGESLDGVILSWNRGAEKMFGYPPEEAIGKQVTFLFPPELKDEVPILLGKVKKGEVIADYDSIRIRKDDSIINVSLSASPIHADDGTVLGASVIERDITKRKQDEAKINRLAQLYAALSSCNKAVTRSLDENELFQQVCISAVQFGGMTMSWIGLVDETNKQVKPVAAFGNGIEYLKGIQISVNADDPYGRGPTGTSIRENRSVWIQDFKNDPMTVPWHERAKQVGWSSSAAIPLLQNNTPIGSLMIYSTNKNAFDNAAQKLLLEMAADISFGLQAFADRAKQKELERIVAESEEDLRNAQKIAKIGSWKVDLGTEKTYWSDETYVLYERDKKLGPPTLQEEEMYYSPEITQYLRELGRKVIETKKQSSFEFPVKLPSGKTGFFLIQITPVINDNGKVTQLSGTVQDITERKQAEEELRKSEKRFRQTLDGMFEGCTIIDFNWTYLYVNDVAAQHGQNRKENLLGRTMLEMYPGVEKTAIFAHFRKCMEERIPQHFEESFTFADNFTHWYEFNVDPVDEGIFVLSIETTERKKAEKSLKQTQLIVDHSQDGIIAASPEGIILSWNKGAEKMFGYLAKEVIGKFPEFLFSPERKKDIQALIDKNNRGESVSNFETVGIQKNGTTNNVLLSISPILDEDNKVIGASVIVRDITELKKTEQTVLTGIKKFEAYTNKAPLGIFVCDKKGQYIDANPTASAMSGYTKEELLRLNIKDLLAPEFINEGVKAFAALNSSGFFKGDLLIAKKSREKLWINLIASKIDEHQFIAFCEDISERKRAEEHIKELNKIRNKFIDIISHQLRTPLGAVNWNLEMLLKGDFGKLEELQQKFLRTTYAASLKTTSRIHDLLEAMDVEEGKVRLDKEEVAVDSILSSIINEKKKECEIKKIFCTYTPLASGLPPIRGDADKIRLVITKLIENAINYTNEGGKISVKLLMKGNIIHFEINDTGVGIPEPEQHRVFERFFRASNASVMLTDAFGLGLYLAKNFIEQHGGKIGFVSKQGAGSTFWFEIPLKQ